jgi:hypothetical protein
MVDLVLHELAKKEHEERVRNAERLARFHSPRRASRPRFAFRNLLHRFHRD